MSTLDEWVPGGGRRAVAARLVGHGAALGARPARAAARLHAATVQAHQVPRTVAGAQTLVPTVRWLTEIADSALTLTVHALGVWTTILTRCTLLGLTFKCC